MIDFAIELGRIGQLGDRTVYISANESLLTRGLEHLAELTLSLLNEWSLHLDLGVRRPELARQGRHRRGDVFVGDGDDLFGEPGWDILLYLYAAQLEQRRVTITKLQTAAAAPSSRPHPFLLAPAIC